MNYKKMTYISLTPGLTHRKLSVNVIIFYTIIITSFLGLFHTSDFKYKS